MLQSFNGPTVALLVALAVLWTLPWKGYALWSAARLSHRWWFIALLILNTLAVLEIIYIFAIARPAQKRQRGSGAETI